MNAGRVDRRDHRHLPPQSPKLIDLTSGFDPGVMRRTMALIQPAVETLLHLDRVNRCYAEYHETLDACKGPQEIFISALTALGVGYDLRRELLAEGRRVRVYVPFGAAWYEYSVRRLRENPAMAGHVIRNLFTRKG